MTRGNHRKHHTIHKTRGFTFAYRTSDDLIIDTKTVLPEHTMKSVPGKSKPSSLIDKKDPSTNDLQWVLKGSQSPVEAKNRGEDSILVAVL